MSVILHLSDTHFGTEQLPVVEALLRLAAEQTPQLAVLSGDLTQRARPSQFDAAAVFMKRLALPSLVVAGNHDISLSPVQRTLMPYARFRRAMGREMEPVVDSPNWLVLGVNTTRWYRHTNGEVSEAQISRVAGRLRAARVGQLRVVVTHQPVHVTRKRDEHNLLEGREAAIAAWTAAGADLILGGHIHLPFFASLREHEPALPREIWAVQAGTAISSRVRYEAPNSVNLIRYDPAKRVRTCLLERWDFEAESESFQLVNEQKVKLDRG